MMLHIMYVYDIDVRLAHYMFVTLKEKPTMKAKSLACVMSTAVLLSACAQQYGDPYGRPTPPPAGVMNGGGINKSDIGTLGGAIGGGIIGSNIGGGKGNIAATIGGTLLGAYLGNQIGSSLDNADRAAYNNASQRALETAQPGQSMPWSNASSGNSGTITPSGYYQNSSGQYCREYSQTINVGGRVERGYGTACRQPDGTWVIVE